MSGARCVTLRIYMPKEQAIDGTGRLPQIQRPDW
jgi:hypothetical protein